MKTKVLKAEKDGVDYKGRNLMEERQDFAADQNR
jgi:hypothetical protein